MRIIPVLDVMGGVVVRAVGGRREEYRPVRSRLTDSTDPVEVARVLIEEVEAERIYVADLDAITGRDTKARLAATIADAFPRVWVWVDQGIRTAADVKRVPIWKRTSRIPFFGWKRRGNLVPVLGSETLSGPEAADAAAWEFSPQLAFSVDLFDGRWLGECEPWRDRGIDENSDLIALAEAGLGVSNAAHLIILDLARVGRGGGTGTEQWVRRAKERFDSVEIVAGGGVRDWDDMKRLEHAGVDAVLVASALHDGTLRFPRPAS